LIKNNLKRKQERLTNESCLFSVVVTSKNTIINYLIKKLKLDLTSTRLIVWNRIFMNLESNSLVYENTNYIGLKLDLTRYNF